MKKSVLILSLLILSMVGAYASVANDSTIATVINNTESGTITIVQPAALNQRLVRVEPQPRNEELDADTQQERPQHQSVARSTYRVQIFADNNVRTSKDNAQRRKAMIQSRFPNMATYISFASPYWRVRVGNFRTKAEAETALSQIRSAFPSMARDLRVVKE